jgi:hypothetical protein
LYVAPLPQIPFALFGPQPLQLWPTVSVVAVHTSAPPQLPAIVEHPETALHAATQHSLVAPTPHAVVLVEQVHEVQVPAPSQ